MLHRVPEINSRLRALAHEGLTTSFGTNEPLKNDLADVNRSLRSSASGKGVITSKGTHMP